MDINAASSENAFIEKGNQPATYQHFPNVTQKKTFSPKNNQFTDTIQKLSVETFFFMSVWRKKMQSLQVKLKPARVDTLWAWYKRIK